MDLVTALSSESGYYTHSQWVVDTRLNIGALLYGWSLATHIGKEWVLFYCSVCRLMDICFHSSNQSVCLFSCACQRHLITLTLLCMRHLVDNGHFVVSTDAGIVWQLKAFDFIATIRGMNLEFLMHKCHYPPQKWIIVHESINIHLLQIAIFCA